MGLKFDTFEDVRLRLHRTICMYKGHPYYVSNERINPPSTEVWLYPVDYRNYNQDELDKIKIKVDHHDPDFETRSPPLGYAFYRNRAYYVSRIPDRRQRQGLSPESLRVDPSEIDNISLFTSKSIEDCILGRHKSPEEAVIMIETNQAKSVPIHRHMAIGKIQNNHVLGLYYRNRLIGTKDSRLLRFNLIQSRDVSFLIKIVDKMGLL